MLRVAWWKETYPRPLPLPAFGLAASSRSTEKLPRVESARRSRRTRMVEREILDCCAASLRLVRELQLIPRRRTMLCTVFQCETGFLSLSLARMCDSVRSRAKWDKVFSRSSLGTAGSLRAKRSKRRRRSTRGLGRCAHTPGSYGAFVCASIVVIRMGQVQRNNRELMASSD